MYTCDLYIPDIDLFNTYYLNIALTANHTCYLYIPDYIYLIPFTYIALTANQ